MNRNERAISAAILSLAALFGLAACGGGGGGMTGGGAAPVTFGVGVDRDHAADPNMSALLADDGRPIVTTTAAGMDISVGGRTVEFAARHLGAHPLFPSAYYREEDPDENQFLFPWPENDADDYTKLYTWNVTQVDRSQNPVEFGRSDTVWFVQGMPTADIPVSGTATYAGFARGWVWPKTAVNVFHNSPTTTNIRGDFTMTARFGASGAHVTGEFSNMVRWAGDADRSDATAIPGTMTFVPTVDGNRLSIDGVSGSGPLAGFENISARAGFFGPEAAEVGGVFEGDNPRESKVLTGAFAGGKR